MHDISNNIVFIDLNSLYVHVITYILISRNILRPYFLFAIFLRIKLSFIFAKF